MAWDKSYFILRDAATNLGNNTWVYRDTVTPAVFAGSGYIANGDLGVRLGDTIEYTQVDSQSAPTNVVCRSIHTAKTIAAASVTASSASNGMVLTHTDLITVSATAAQARFVVPFAFSIVSAYSVINQALTTGDATITLSIDGVAVTGGVITITQSGSAEDDVDVATPTALNVGTAGGVITATVGGTNDAVGSLANLFVHIVPAD